MLLDGYGPLGSERVALDDLFGRILAEPLRANHDQPPEPVSAMDGYAVRAIDAIAGARLRLIGKAPAGAPFSGQLRPGECVRIATGGVVPAGAERIIIQEEAVRDGDGIIIGDVSGPSFIRPAAMDFTSGQTLLEAGQPVGAAAVGLAAASGAEQATVHRRPRVTILASGNELRDPGQPLAPGTTYNSAGFALAALVEQWGGIPHLAPILPDDLDRTVAEIQSLDQRSDLFVPLGGASVGELDLFRPAFAKVGAKPMFWRINVVPGKPCWHARMQNGRAVLGLPGNPSSAFVCAHLLLKPLVDALLGRDPTSSPTLQSARLASLLQANGSREAWLRASVSIDAAGSAIVSVDRRQDSSLQTPLLTANALVRRAPFAPLGEAGGLVEWLPISQC